MSSLIQMEVCKALRPLGDPHVWTAWRLNRAPRHSSTITANVKDTSVSCKNSTQLCSDGLRNTCFGSVVEGVTQKATNSFRFASKPVDASAWKQYSRALAISSCQ